MKIFKDMIIHDLKTKENIFYPKPNERGVVVLPCEKYLGKLPNRDPDFSSDFTSQVDGTRVITIGWYV